MIAPHGDDATATGSGPQSLFGAVAFPGEAHITLAWGRDYGDVTPVKGVVMGGGAHTLSVTVDVVAQKET
jgi:hypothetical protein